MVARKPRVDAGKERDEDPAARAMTAARGSNTRPEFGQREADGVEELEEPLREQEPEKRPTIEATTPTTSASTMTEPRICRFVAPIVRSVANSRVR